MVVLVDVDMLDWTRGKDGGGVLVNTMGGSQKGLAQHKANVRLFLEYPPLDVTMWNPFQQLDNGQVGAPIAPTVF